MCAWPVISNLGLAAWRRSVVARCPCGFRRVLDNEAPFAASLVVGAVDRRQRASQRLGRSCGVRRFLSKVHPRSLSDLLSRMRCRAKKAMDARRAAPQVSGILASRATPQTRFLAATRRDVAFWTDFGVARPRPTPGRAWGARHGLSPTAPPWHARKQVRQAPRVLGTGPKFRWQCGGSCKPTFLLTQGREPCSASN
jgi:hypothetical protein